MIDLPIRERWQVVDVLRTVVYQCLATAFEGDAFAELASMVAGELVENALKHGAWGRGEEPIDGEARMRIFGRPAGVEIEVVNPLPPGIGTGTLYDVLDRIRNAPTPQDAYVERLREVARESSAVSGGLGLMRIAYEANCMLSAVVEGQILSVRASVDVPPDLARRGPAPSATGPSGSAEG